MKRRAALEGVLFRGLVVGPTVTKIVRSASWPPIYAYPMILFHVLSASPPLLPCARMSLEHLTVYMDSTNLHLLASVDQTLLLGRDAFLLLDALLYALDLFTHKSQVSDLASWKKSEAVEARLRYFRGSHSQRFALFCFSLAAVGFPLLRFARLGVGRWSFVPCSRTRCPARSLCRSGCGLCGSGKVG